MLGTHEALLTNNGIYAQLVARQMYPNSNPYIILYILAFQMYANSNPYIIL